MCDYSLDQVASRPAKVGDKLVVSTFPATNTRGLSEEGKPDVAVCLLPGTEIAFDRVPEVRDVFSFFRLGRIVNPSLVARFTQIGIDNPYQHHDTLEFPDGGTVLINWLIEGQRISVLQLPANKTAAKSDGASVKPEAVS